MNYSVIIPHRDIPELLERCLASIPQREDLEIIIIDDNSNPNKVNFDYFPGLERADVTIVFTKEGRGAGFARNQGLLIAKGKWLIFADADDYFTDNLNQILDKYADNEDTDVVFFNAEKFDENDNKSSVNLQLYINNYFHGSKYSEQVLKYGCWAPWTRMIRREIPIKNDIRFEEVPVGNDMMFVLQSTTFAKNISVEKDIIYRYYRPSWGSLTDKQRTPDKALMRFEARCTLNDFYRKIHYPFIWPLWRDYRKIKDKVGVKTVLKRHKYSYWADIKATIAYGVAKAFHIL